MSLPKKVGISAAIGFVITILAQFVGLPAWSGWIAAGAIGWCIGYYL